MKRDKEVQVNIALYHLVLSAIMTYSTETCIHFWPGCVSSWLYRTVVRHILTLLVYLSHFSESAKLIFIHALKIFFEQEQLGVKVFHSNT